MMNALSFLIGQCISSVPMATRCSARESIKKIATFLRGNLEIAC